MKRLKIELENLKDNDGTFICLPTIIIAIDIEDKAFYISIGYLWYAFTIIYYYGKNLDC